MTQFWLMLTIAGLVVAVYFIVKEGFKQGSMYFVFPVISGMMYGFRKFMTGKMEKNERENQS